jgi:hypothetical protein
MGSITGERRVKTRSRVSTSNSATSLKPIGAVLYPQGGTP